MSNEPRIHELIAVFNSGGWESLLPALTDDVVLVSPNGSRYEGPEGYRDAMEIWFQAFDNPLMEVVRLEERGNSAFAEFRQRARMGGSAHLVEQTFFSVNRFRDGRICFQSFYADELKARADFNS